MIHGTCRYEGREIPLKHVNAARLVQALRADARRPLQVIAKRLDIPVSTLWDTMVRIRPYLRIRVEMEWDRFLGDHP